MGKLQNFDGGSKHKPGQGSQNEDPAGSQPPGRSVVAVKTEHRPHLIHLRRSMGKHLVTLQHQPDESGQQCADPK
jgi:hypothetical protein